MCVCVSVYVCVFVMCLMYVLCLCVWDVMCDLASVKFCACSFIVTVNNQFGMKSRYTKLRMK